MGMGRKSGFAKYIRHMWMLTAAALLLALPRINARAEDVLIEEGRCGPEATYRGYDTDGDGTADKLVISGTDRIWDWSIQNHLWRGDNGPLEARTLIIEDGITQIGACENAAVEPQGAFCTFRHLTSVTIPDSVTIIGERTFMYCDSLADIKIPDSVTRIKFQAFEGCGSLADVKLPEVGLTAIDDGTFRGCESLKSIEIPGCVASIGKNAFDASGLTEVTLPGSVVSIGRNAFFDCLDLKKVTIWNGDAALEEHPGFAFKRPDDLHGTYVDYSDYTYGVTIYGYAGSTAERYVEEVTSNPDRIAFIELDSNWQGGYWYEDGVKQGVRYLEDGTLDLSYRGKEIFDPETNAWYWLDSVQDGAVAKSKDVYQESAAGEWAECADGTGKWVRYDEDGHMVKGWDENSIGKFYFDLQYGTMAKGYVTIGTWEYYFNMETGVLERGTKIPQYGLAEVDGKTVFFLDYKRQGYSAHDKEYRGKEMFYNFLSESGTPSGEWIWLDNAYDGGMAKSKDVYQPEAGAEGIQVHTDPAEGKWVRYDAEGLLMRGWVAGKGEDAVELGYALKEPYVAPLELAKGKDLYFFDTWTGAMAKGDVTLHTPQGDVTFHFDEVTGILDIP